MKVSYIIECIDQGTIELPEFQRGYVWSRNQVRSLMQSLYAKYPVGGLLTWTTRRGQAKARNPGESTGDTVKLLLDGQQRITSLYGIIRGVPPRFFDGNAAAFTGLQFNLDDETFEFYAPVKMRDNPKWISVTELMQDKDLTSWIARISANEDMAPHLAEYVTRLNNILQISETELHEDDIAGSDLSIDEVVDIFNRVNSGGTKLSKGDLALAKICAEWPDARIVMRQQLSKWNEQGYDFSLDWLLRVANAVVTGEARFTALRSVEPKTFAEGLDRACHCVDALINLVSGRLGFDHNRVLLGKPAFSVMARWLDSHDGKLPDRYEQDHILYWYLHSALWGRYSSSTETALNQDLAALDDGGVDGLIATLDKWRSLEVRMDDFSGYGIGNRFYPMLYLLTRMNGARDWGSGLELSQHMLGKLARLEVHHIFPKALLYEHGYEQRQVNAVSNFAFQTQSTNLTIGRQAPSDYFPEIANNQPGVDRHVF